MNGIIRVALYARVSSQKQADDKTIRSQRAAIIERIEKDELRVAQEMEFCDEGYSGSELHRPALEVLRDRVAASLVDRIYVHTPDRLARRYSHQALLLEEFAKYDCQVIFGDHQGLADSPETNLLVQMQGVIAEYERDKILERTRRGRRYSAAAGNVSVFGGAPYGYQYIKRSGDQKRARWIIDPVESEHVRLIFQMVGNQGYSLGAVCRELAKQGIKTKKGNATWHNATIHDMLVNPAYYGKARYGKQRLVPRKPGKRAKHGDPVVPRRAKVTEDTDPEDQIVIVVPAIIDQTLFDHVQETLKENRRRQRQRQEGSRNMLSGLILCGQCGSAYCARRRNGGKYFDYRCIGGDRFRRRGKPKCENRRVNGYELERFVWSDVCQLLTDPKRISEELSRRCESEDTAGSLQQTIVQVESTISHLQERIDRIIDAYESGHVEKSEFERRIVPLREHQDRERAALSSLRGDLADHAGTSGVEAAIKKLSEEVSGNLATASEELKRDLCKLLIKRIEIGMEEIRLVYKVPPNPFVKGPENQGFVQHCLERALTTSWSVPNPR
jgi:site-specific DNA recombinase